MIIVTPRLVRPVRAGSARGCRPTASTPPNEADLFLLGRTDTGVPPHPSAIRPSAAAPAAGSAAAPGRHRAARKPTGFEKEYGHVL